MEKTPQSPFPLEPGLDLSPPVSPPQSRPWGFGATLGWSLLVFLVYTAAQCAVMWTGARLGVFRFTSVEAFRTSGLVAGVVSVSCAPVLVGLCFLVAGIRRGISVRDYFGLFLPARRIIATWCVSLILFGIGWDVVSILCGQAVMYETMAPMYQSAGIVPLFWVAMLVAAPLGEEIFFRGLLLPGWQRSRLGPVGAVILISVIWAFFHYQYGLWEKCEVFIIGVILGFARVKTGSLLLCILAHSLMNLVGGVAIVIFLSQRPH